MTAVDPTDEAQHAVRRRRERLLEIHLYASQADGASTKRRFSLPRQRDPLTMDTVIMAGLMATLFVSFWLAFVHWLFCLAPLVFIGAVILEWRRETDFRPKIDPPTQQTLRSSVARYNETYPNHALSWYSDPIAMQRQLRAALARCDRDLKALRLTRQTSATVEENL